VSSVTDDIFSLGITPNKALGQNFLCDESAIAAIVGCAADPGLPVLEIGPGLGALTLPLAGKGLPLAAVELDSVLAEVLGKKLTGAADAHIIQGDFLKTDLAYVHKLLGGGSITAVGNLPYYITSPICERLILSSLPMQRMVLMMQREAAERFFAKPCDKVYGPLSVMAQSLYDVNELLRLDPSSYYPQPEVSSTVIVLLRNGKTMPRLLPRLLKCAFAMRRKTLCNNLTALGLTKPAAAELIAEMGLGDSVRAEAVEPSAFEAMALRLEDAAG